MPLPFQAPSIDRSLPVIVGECAEIEEVTPTIHVLFKLKRALDEEFN